MPNFYNIKLPRQRLSYKSKNKQWRIDNVDYGDKYSYYFNEEVRQTLQNKIINLNLFNGIVDVRDMTKVLNPYDLDADFIPDNIPHHPIMIPKIELLIGEEAKRRFDWHIVVTNPDAITKKENDKKELLTQKIVEFLKGNYQDEELDKKLKELESFVKYEWQDIRERLANQIMKHYWYEEEFQLKFNKGFKDALIMGEELYQVDIVHDSPKLFKLNPLKVHSIRGSHSDKIEDSSLLILEDHWSPSKIVDFFHDQLKQSEIDKILESNARKGSSAYVDDENHIMLRDGLENPIDGYITMAQINGHTFRSDYTDAYGNIRVLRVYWKSVKKIKKVKYYDEFGNIQFKIMSEEYIPNEALGEEVTDLWVNEVWEGTKIGRDIYVQMRPKKVQYTKLNNPSLCHAGIIGQVYNTNQGRAISLVDRIKNYQYLYDVIWDRLNKAISTNYGKLMDMDLAMIPNNWDVEKWLHFATVNKIRVRDSFKEGNQGAASGKLAGMMSQASGGVDMTTGNEIQQYINILEYIKIEMGEISGVSRQREGQVENRETKGGIERAVTQSSHITEYWFLLHEKLKLRVMEAFLETAKIALKGKNLKAQYILDDETIQALNLDGDDFAENDYGIIVTNSYKTSELEETLKTYAQAFMQNGGSFSAIMDIYLSSSLADMRRKLEKAENDLHEQNSQQAQEQNKLQREQMEKQDALEKARLELEDIKNIRDNETKRYIADKKDNENSNDGIVDPLQYQKFDLDLQKRKDDLMIKMKDLSQDMQKHKDNVKLKEKQIAVSKIKKSTNSNS